MCHNCHAVLHAVNSGSVTFEQEQERLREQEKKSLDTLERDRKVKELASQGFSPSDIARLFGISKGLAYKIVKGSSLQEE